MLEEKALELIITSKEPVDLKYFSAAYQGLVEATKALDAEQYTIYDAKFHLSLIAATGNDKLIQIAQIFKNDFYLFQHESNKFLLRNSEDQEKQREHFRKPCPITINCTKQSQAAPKNPSICRSVSLHATSHV
ncbi:MAG: FCD domain-containing protein [Enterocloster clostridioformis]